MQNGFDALFVNCAELIADLSCASRDGRLREALARYLKPHVLVIDEVGYLTYGDDAANVLFHVVNERHIKRRSMVFTTNKHPKRWGKVLHDDDLAEVIVDRVLERGRLLRLDGPSIRTKHLADDMDSSDDRDEAERLRISGKRGSDFPEPTPTSSRWSTSWIRPSVRPPSPFDGSTNGSPPHFETRTFSSRLGVGGLLRVRSNRERTASARVRHRYAAPGVQRGARPPATPRRRPAELRFPRPRGGGRRPHRRSWTGAPASRAVERGARDGGSGVAARPGDALAPH